MIDLIGELYLLAGTSGITKEVINSARLSRLIDKHERVGATEDEFNDLRSRTEKIMQDIEGRLGKLQEASKSLITSTRQGTEATILKEVQKTVQTCNQLFTQCKSLLEELQTCNKRFAQMEDTNGASFTSEIQIRNNALLVLSKKFRSLISDFQEYNSRFSQDVRDKSVRQLAIAVPDASEEQLRVMVSQGREPAAEMMRRHGVDRESKLSGLQDRYQSMRRIQESMQQLHQLLIELSLRVDQQGHMLESIEFNVVNAKNYAAKATIALIAQRKFKRKKLLCKFIGFSLFMTVLFVIMTIILAPDGPLWEEIEETVYMYYISLVVTLSFFTLFIVGIAKYCKM